MIDIDFSLSNGDMNTVVDDENMITALTRRLNTYYESSMYDEYGSVLETMLGMRKSEVNLQIICQEIEHCIMQDVRVNTVSVDGEYLPDGMRFSILVNYEDNEEIRFDYEIDDSGNEEDEMNVL